MVNIVCKKWFLFQVEIKKICYQKLLCKGLQDLFTTNQAAPDQMTKPHNKSPCEIRYSLGERFVFQGYKDSDNY